MKRARLTISSTSSGEGTRLATSYPVTRHPASERRSTYAPSCRMGISAPEATDGAEPDRGEGDEGPARAIADHADVHRGVAGAHTLETVGHRAERERAEVAASGRAGGGANDVKREGKVPSPHLAGSTKPVV